MSPIPHNHLKVAKPRKKGRISVARLRLENYNGWQQNRSAIRKWLVGQIAERAIEIFQKRRSEL